MITKKEFLNILGSSLVTAFSITLLSSFNYFINTLFFVFIIISINVFTKKIGGYYFDVNLVVKVWEFKRWGYKKNQYFKKNFQAGYFFPIISRIIFLPLNGFCWMASLTFNTKAKIYRAAKRHGFYSFTEVSEDHLAYIASIGIIANLFFAFIMYLVGISDLAKFSIWFAFFNLIPISNLDGNKIFFGSKILWSILSSITLLALLYSILIV